ncbi:hypothetical protein [Plesiomonas sp. PI-19]|uniref:hypothetical protein n=1 Tax=Plesiomonas sp. PI-19 TaxID=2898798 RepID=UPI001F3648B3|nr:hypothetical protein [Plesiomonas sp. PI-19]MCE5165601.1 hypothetical protein [Plesiomonas sp. PI-19]
MTNAELLEKVKPIAESMSQNIASKQHVFNSHKSIIDECKNKGVSNQLITNAINHHLTEGSKLTLHYFKLLLNRSKSQSKKTGIKNENLTDIIREGGIKGTEESHTKPIKGFFSKREEERKIEHNASATMAKFEDKYK